MPTDPPGWGPTTPGPASFSVMGPAEVEINQQTRQGSTAFTITNLTGRPVRARLLPRALQGADPSWISIAGPPEVPMAVGATITAPLNLAIPPTAAGGTYLVRMDVVPEDDTEAEVQGPSVSFVVPPAATPKRTPKWLLPLIIGLVVLVLLIGAGAFFVLRNSNAGGGPSTGPSTPGGGPRWADWQDLGGTYNSAPAVASWAANRLDWFALGPGNNMLHQGFDGPNAGAIDNLSGVFTSAPAAVSWGPNRIDIFGRGTDGQLWHNWWAGGWGNWEPLGGSLASDPTVSSWGANRLDVFWKGTDNQLMHKWWAGGWSGIEPLGGNLEGAPAAVSRGNNLIDVCYRGRDNHLYQKTWDGTRWNPPKDLGAGLTSDVRVSSWGMDRLDVFAEGNDNTLLHRSWDGTTWTGWENLGGGIDDPPAAVSWGPNRIDLFARGTNNQLLHRVYS